MVNAVSPIAYTRMTEMIQDDEFRNFLELHYPPERVAPLVTWLCHEELPCTGQIFTAGGGRVARVFLGVTPGFTAEGLTPEALRDHFDADLRRQHGAFSFRADPVNKQAIKALVCNECTKLRQA